MARFTRDDHDIVFSSDGGDQRRRKPRPDEVPDAGDGIVRVRRETKGRKGKTVTTVVGVPVASAELAALAKELRRRCGTGGGVKDGAIELQGDHRETLVAELERLGFVVKLAGG